MCLLSVRDAKDVYALLFSSPSLYHSAIAEVNGAVGDRGQVVVVCHDDEGLTEAIAKVEE